VPASCHGFRQAKQSPLGEDQGGWMRPMGPSPGRRIDYWQRSDGAAWESFTNVGFPVWPNGECLLRRWFHFLGMGVVGEMATPALNAIPVKSSHTASQVIDGEAVILDIPGKTLRGLNSVGSRIWELVDGARTLNEIAQVVAREYGRADTEMQQDVVVFFGELAERRVVEFKADR